VCVNLVGTNHNRYIVETVNPPYTDLTNQQPDQSHLVYWLYTGWVKKLSLKLFAIFFI